MTTIAHNFIFIVLIISHNASCIVNLKLMGIMLNVSQYLKVVNCINPNG